MNRARALIPVPLLLAVAFFARPAWGGSHLWRIVELFSNDDGTIQFIEMKECCGSNGEYALFFKWIRSEATGNQYDIMENLPCFDCTAHRHVLFATAGFAQLPGAPVPDHIIPDQFFDTTGDEIVYWFYPKATMSFTAGELPTDGIHSLNKTATKDGTNFIAPNSPENFAQQAGSVVVSCHPADLDASGDVGFADILAMFASWGPCAPCAADVDLDGQVDAGDLLVALGAWGPCTQ